MVPSSRFEKTDTQTTAHVRGQRVFLDPIRCRTSVQVTNKLYYRSIAATQHNQQAVFVAVVSSYLVPCSCDRLIVFTSVLPCVTSTSPQLVVFHTAGTPDRWFSGALLYSVVVSVWPRHPFASGQYFFSTWSWGALCCSLRCLWPSWWRCRKCDDRLRWIFHHISTDLTTLHSPRPMEQLKTSILAKRGAKRLVAGRSGVAEG